MRASIEYSISNTQSSPDIKPKILALNGESHHLVGDTQAFLAILKAVSDLADLQVLSVAGPIADIFEEKLPDATITRAPVIPSLPSKVDKLYRFGTLMGRSLLEIASKRPNILLTYDRTVAVDVAAACGRLTGTPVIEHLNNNQMFDLQAGRYRRLEKAGTEFWSCSDYVKTQAIAAGVQGHHETIRNSFNTPPSELTQAAARHELNLPLDKKIAVIVGRYSPFKGQDTAIEAMKLLQNQPGSENLILALAGYDNGDGVHLSPPIPDYQKYLADKIASLQLENQILLMGRQPGQLVFRAADYALAPSTEEPFGLVIAEAMSSGIPVIASDTGAFPETITHNHSGLLVPISDPNSLASAIHQLQTNPEFAEKLSRNASLEVVPQLTPNRLENDVAAAITSFMKRHYPKQHTQTI